MPSSSRELNEGVRRSLRMRTNGRNYDRFGTVPGAAGSQGPRRPYVDFDDLFGAASAAWATSSDVLSAAPRGGGRAVRKGGS